MPTGRTTHGICNAGCKWDIKINLSAFWEQVGRASSLKAIVVECSYPALMADMANLSRHMHTTALISRISALAKEVISVIVHRKPGYEQQIASELTDVLGTRDLRLPEPGQRYQFA